VINLRNRQRAANVVARNAAQSISENFSGTEIQWMVCSRKLPFLRSLRVLKVKGLKLAPQPFYLQSTTDSLNMCFVLAGRK
jgi:hypothetical protein